jgi:Flp pilus assembly protein TadG
MKSRRRQRGATIVEAAFTLLILFMLLDGILEFGRAYNIYQIMTNAAREGARYAVAPTPGTANMPSTAQVQSTVQGFLNSGGVQGAAVTVNTSTQTVNSEVLNYTTVQVTAPYAFVVPQLLFGNNNVTSVNLSTTATMRNEVQN